MEVINYQIDETGKKVAVIIPIDYWDEEHKSLKKESNTIKKTNSKKLNQKKKPIDFFGSLKMSDEKFQDFLDHVKKSREEWD